MGEDGELEEEMFVDGRGIGMELGEGMGKFEKKKEGEREKEGEKVEGGGVGEWNKKIGKGIVE